MWSNNSLDEVLKEAVSIRLAKFERIKEKGKLKLLERIRERMDTDRMITNALERTNRASMENGEPMKRMGTSA